MKRVSLARLEQIPEADLIEIAPAPGMLKFDRENTTQDFLVSLDLRKSPDFMNRLRMVWHESLETWRKSGVQKTYIVYAIYTDENGQPIFRSKPFPVRVKR